MVFCNFFIAFVTCYTISHNPYFSRWFSAISKIGNDTLVFNCVTILILVDGFLQYKDVKSYDVLKTRVTILILVDGFLQYKRHHYKSFEYYLVTILILVDGFLQ